MPDSITAAGAASHDSSRRPLIVAIIVFLIAAAAAGFLVLKSEQERLQELRTGVSDQAGNSAHAIRRHIERALSATYALAAMVRQGNGSITNFDATARQMLPYYPGATSLQLAPGGIVQQIVPLVGNEKAIGHNLLQDPARDKEAFRARVTGQLTLAGPFNLMQGGFGAAGRLPVFLDDSKGMHSFWGFATVLIRFPEVLEDARLGQLAEKGFVYELWRIHPDTGQKQTLAASSSAALIDPVARTLDMPNGSWTLSIAPIKGWGAPFGLTVKAALGMLFSLLLGYLAKLLVEMKAHKQHLEALVVQRTAEITATQSTLRATFDAITDLIWLKDADGVYLDCNPMFERYFGAKKAELIGKTDYDFVDKELADSIREHDCNAIAAGEPSIIEEHLTFAEDGRRGLFETTKIPMRNAEGKLLAVLSLAHDINDRKQAEQQLRIAATAFESPEGMFITDANRVILRVNRAFSSITGYSAEETVGQTPHLLSSGRHDAAFFAAMAESLEISGTWQGEIWNRRKNGELYPVWLTISTVLNNAGVVDNYVAALSDITARKAADEEIKNLAFYDPLTSLPNRRLFLVRLEHTLAGSARHQRKGALLFIDLDNFKTINDTLGHEKGDQLLQQVAQRLSSCVRDCDTVARFGGDEFLVMLEDLSENLEEAATQAETVGKKIIETLEQTYHFASYEHHSSASIGITLFSDHQKSIKDLLKRADLAMYQAKAAGRNTLRFFDPEMQAVVSARAALEVGLREAVRKEQFALYYQAQVNGEGCLTGVEALVRWQHPQRGIVSSADFIPVAEETGLILPIGQWVLETACAQLATWAIRPEMAHLTIAVNISVHQFQHRDFVAQVLTAINRSGANPKRLKLELTESMLVSNVEDIIIKMTVLKREGVSFSLDDFGTGYSSLSYLKLLPLDQLKIDQSFVRDILIDPNDAAIAKMVIVLGESLGLAVIAEGVENESQREFLARLGCNAYQGYLFSRPLSLEAFEGFVQRRYEHSAAA